MVTKSDDLIVAGFAMGLDFGNATLPPGNGAAFVAKLGPDGEHVWSRYLADAPGVKRIRLAADGDGVIVFGDFEGTLDFGAGSFASAGFEDGFVVKLDGAGGHVWSRHLAGAEGELAADVGVDAAGNVFVAGSFAGAIDLGGGPLQSEGAADVFVAKLDPDGNHIWSKRFGDAEDQRCWSAAVDVEGNVLLTGRFQSAIDFGGGPLVGAGDVSERTYVAKLDADGNHLWSHRIETGDYDDPGLIATDAAGNVLVAGNVGDGDETVELLGNAMSSSEPAIFVAKLDPAGNFLWSRVVAGIGERAWSMAAGPSAVFVSGTALVATLAALDGDGALLWAEGYLAAGGADAFALTQSIAVDTAGNPVITGAFYPTIDFGCGPQQAKFGADIFVAKLRP